MFSTCNKYFPTHQQPILQLVDNGTSGIEIFIEISVVKFKIVRAILIKLSFGSFFDFHFNLFDPFLMDFNPYWMDFDPFLIKILNKRSESSNFCQNPSKTTKLLTDFQPFLIINDYF